ncbi:ABC transporter E family member 2 [Tanacetum coccineum]|uniref:ABC transporter E family member 2 n=1 Tax=Tanacetum coccineum TaxID=301880 RepID=A0ABQ5DSW9_9ASTR
MQDVWMRHGDQALKMPNGFEDVVDKLPVPKLGNVVDRKVGELSGGELQRFAIVVCVVQDAQMYMFDEPSSYLDIKQRLKAAQVIRSLLTPKRLYRYVLTHSALICDSRRARFKCARLLAASMGTLVHMVL